VICVLSVLIFVALYKAIDTNCTWCCIVHVSYRQTPQQQEETRTFYKIKAEKKKAEEERRKKEDEEEAAKLLRKVKVA
jgi:hypothetical protein